MDINYVRKLCEGLGAIKMFKKDNAFFGNIELEVETPRKQFLSIVSDRGIFSCYIITQKLFKKRIPIETIINNNKNIEFYTLEDAINFLKKHIDIL